MPSSSSSSSSEFDWEAPPLSGEDLQLVSIYSQVGRTVDDLPYTPEFDRIVSLLGLMNSDENKHAVFSRLLRLRKMGRLPRLTAGSST